MFTGLVEMTGVLVGLHGEHLRLRPSKKFEKPVYGESVAVNGCCLTLERELAGGVLEFFTLAETQRRTNLGKLKPGALLNMERALRLGDRLGGHIVSGHIDAAAEVIDFRRMADGDYELRVALPESLAPEIVEKGSIAIDGVSLTVVDVGKSDFSVCLIPVTRNDTALVARTPGTLVNLEGDLVGKYIRRQFELRMEGAAAAPAPSGITMDTLREAGFL
ncbi:riboflavin synthase [uncultured Victivallis sp.]|uniref:riboflavin synthase n=1 Tax=uncultured Victivallis sp. TaxID=354118 RepID=UPI0025F247BF|nr:riboflavin synthase [uncultured Victivallis sp.]